MSVPEKKTPLPPMSKYRLLGKSGLRVSQFCLGAMTFGTSRGWEWTGSVDKETTFAILDAFVEAGGNFIDTADVYQMGQSEEFIGEWMETRKNRSRIVLATKYSGPRGTDINATGNHRKHMMDAINASLKRLRTDYIDLYYVHWWDHTVPPEDVLHNLQDLVHTGKVHHLGISDTPAWVVARANGIAEVRGWHKYVAFQMKHSLIDREVERDIIPMSRANSMGLVPWNALGAGKLTGKFGRNKKPTADEANRQKSPWYVPPSDYELKVIDAVEEVAKELNATCSQVAIAWLLRDPAMSVLVGVRNVQQLKDNLGAFNIKFTDAQVQKLNEASKIALGFPHDFTGQHYHENRFLRMCPEGSIE